jgi:tripeptide aminopeptidase
MPTPVLERFLRYVTHDTQSREGATEYPSTPGQLTLLRELVAELQAIGIADAAIDQYGYVMATVPATTRKADVPVIGFIAHVDTSPEMSGAGVRPIVHRAKMGVISCCRTIRRRSSGLPTSRTSASASGTTS